MMKLRKQEKGNLISEIPPSPLARHIVEQNGITCDLRSDWNHCDWYESS